MEETDPKIFGNPFQTFVEDYFIRIHQNTHDHPGNNNPPYAVAEKLPIRWLVKNQKNPGISKRHAMILFR
jgi:hypothetical protein